MRRLLPDVADEDLDSLYVDLDVPAGVDRPHLYLGMVSSVDGAATVGGRTADLGGAADRVAFSRLRETCDAILVGAETVRAEDYGPPRTRSGGAQRRAARGLAPVPTIVVVTASLDLDPGARLFSDPDRRPVVLVPEDADTERVARLATVADVERIGAGRVDLVGGIARLHARGWTRVLCEGGPRLNAQLLAAGLVDEIFLTITPTVVAGDAPRIATGVGPAVRAAELLELRHHDGELLARYRLR